MYGLKYIIPFKTLSNISCEIRLEEKDFSGTSLELRAGETPIVIDVEESDLLAPIRSSGTTIQVYGSSYLQDLYSSDPQGIKITLLRNGSVKWIGFLTPDTFSQDFSSPEFIYELECVSAFSTLKYKEFDLTDDFVTFWDIINEARILAGYQDIYYTNSVKAEFTDYFNLKIASANFYDELGEAMTYYEVLEQIAMFAGCCWTPYEDDLYFLDYQAIRSGYTSYTKNDGINSTQITLQDLKTVTNYKGTGTKLSRIAGKNKAIINCSLYEIDNILPDPEEHLGLGVGQSVVSAIKDGKDQKRHYLVTVPAIIKNDRIQTLQQGIDKGRSTYTYVVRYTEDAIPNKLNFDSELRVMYYVNFAGRDAGNVLGVNDAVLILKSERDVFLHQGVYLSFSCEMQANVDGSPYSLGYGQPESPDNALIMTEAWSEALSDTTWAIPLKLKIGDLFYNGTSWTTTETKFNAFFEIKKGEKQYGRFITIRDDNDYTLGIGDLSGYIVKPPPTAVTGELELTVYAPDLTIVNTNYSVKYAFFKNIKLDYAIQDLEGIFDPLKEKEDVIYESIPNDTYTEEADEIDLKICTNTDGKLAFSSILEGNNFLSKIRTDVFGTGIAEEILLQRVVSLYSKPRFVINPTLENSAKPYTKFTEPHLNRQFLVAGGEEDVKMERCTYNLIEI